LTRCRGGGRTWASAPRGSSASISGWACRSRRFASASSVSRKHCASHPPILIGGSGEQKTLRLVARYADACNIFAGGPDVARHKFEVLREHCEREGRDYDEIERTMIMPVNVGPGGTAPDALLQQLGAYAEAGVQTVLGALLGMERMTPFEVMARDVIPAAAKL
jgi:alkanesulfonate monooxygenase